MMVRLRCLRKPTFLNVRVEIEVKNKRVPLGASKINQQRQMIPHGLPGICTNTSAFRVHSSGHSSVVIVKGITTLNKSTVPLNRRLKFIKAFSCVQNIMLCFKSNPCERTCAFSNILFVFH